MTEEEKPSLLKDSWAKCERIILSLGMKNTEKMRDSIGDSKFSELLNFLRSIGFADEAGLTDPGKDYYKNKFILRDEENSNRILANTLKIFPPTQAICQLLWGRPKLTRESVYRLLVLEGYIDASGFKDSDIGGFLMLLNQCDILRYSKKSNNVKVLYNPRTEEEPKPPAKFLSPQTPYSNIKILREILRNAVGFLHWFDKHFSAKGLEPLTDEADGNKIREIKILTGVTERVDKLKKDFIRFREEMKSRQIKAELRVICDRSILGNIHDRWIISEKNCFNIPPIDVIYQGQYSEIKETTTGPPFDEWWLKGLDIVDQWGEIKHIKYDTANVRHC